MCQALEVLLSVLLSSGNAIRCAVFSYASVHISKQMWRDSVLEVMWPSDRADPGDLCPPLNHCTPSVSGSFQPQP